MIIIGVDTGGTFTPIEGISSELKHLEAVGMGRSEKIQN